MAMNATDKVVEIAKKQCRTHGVRPTSKRINIFSLLLKSKKAASAYELVDSYKQVFNKPVPVMTVYRVLEFLQSKNLVHKLDTANKFVACTHMDCDHMHHASQFLICKQCQTVKELHMSLDQINEIKQTIEQTGFHLLNSQIEMNCICEVCYADAQ